MAGPAMDDLGFLEQAAAADASATSTLMVLLPDGAVSHIQNINKFALLDKCPLLYHAFELCESSDNEQASIEVCISFDLMGQCTASVLWLTLQQGYVAVCRHIASQIHIHWHIPS